MLSRSDARDVSGIRHRPHHRRPDRAEDFDKDWRIGRPDVPEHEMPAEASGADRLSD